MGKTAGPPRVETDQVNTFQGSADPVFQAKVAGDTYPRVSFLADGTKLTGDGTGAPATGGTYVQTFATAGRTHAARTAAAVVATAATNTSPYGFSQAQADALVAAVNALQVDLANTAGVLNAVVDDLQAQKILLGS